MSLLMEALKKAERQAGAPAADKAPPGRGLPELPDTLELIDIDLPEPVAVAPPPSEFDLPAKAISPAARLPAPPANRGDDGAALALASALAAESGKRRAGLWLGIGALLAATAIGAYFSWHLLAPTASGLTTNLPPPAPAAGPQSALPATAVTEKPATPEPPPAEDRATRVRMPTPAIQTPAPGVEGVGSIRVSRAAASAPAGLQRAHEALATGDWRTATAEFQTLLQDDPRSGEALRGLAAVALRQGKNAEAATYYQRALEADPADTIAIAGLLGLRPGADAIQTESRLKGLLASQPENPHLNFALGNTYAATDRWLEAEQVYFKAVAGAPDNPDYNYNLAISLDHLRQSALAAQYYRKALTAAGGKGGSFPAAQAQERLRQLEVQP